MFISKTKIMDTNATPKPFPPKFNERYPIVNPNEKPYDKSVAKDTGKSQTDKPPKKMNNEILRTFKKDVFIISILLNTPKEKLSIKLPISSTISSDNFGEMFFEKTNPSITPITVKDSTNIYFMKFSSMCLLNSRFNSYIIYPPNRYL